MTDPSLSSLDIQSINQPSSSPSTTTTPQQNASNSPPSSPNLSLSTGANNEEEPMPHLSLSIVRDDTASAASGTPSPVSLLNTFNDPNKRRKDEDDKQLVTPEILQEHIPKDLMILNYQDMKTVGQLGAGAYGIVYKVRYNDVTYALKAVHWNHTTKREIEVMHSVKSKYVMNLCGIVYSEEDPYSIYLLLDYMNLRSTAEMMQVLRQKPIPEPIIAKMAVQILKGLRDLHMKRIVHRDIKPANVLLNDAGQIKLADFGVSGRIDTSRVQFKTTDAFTTFQGTFLFMSPERLRCEPYSYGSDIWAFAMTLSEYAHGHYPLKDLNDHSIWSVIQTIDNPSFTIPLPQDASEEFRDFIKQCSAFEPKDRSRIEDLLKHDFIEKNIHERPKFVNWLRSEYVKPLKAQKMKAHKDRKRRTSNA